MNNELKLKATEVDALKNENKELSRSISESLNESIKSTASVNHLHYQNELAQDEMAKIKV
jgi:hypothetical protein